MTKKSVLALVVFLMLLLGVQRTPEAQVGEAFMLVGGVITTGIVAGGCVHFAATTNPDLSPEQVMEPGPH